jgi:hypothetical protein
LEALSSNGKLCDTARVHSNPRNSPRSDPSIIECELHVVRLDKSPAYEVLPYVWGNPDPPDYVICDGQRKAVTQNLGAALKHLRLDDRSVLHVLLRSASISIDTERTPSEIEAWASVLKGVIVNNVYAMPA